MLSGGEESDSGDNELLSDGDGESGDSDAAAAFVFDGKFPAGNLSYDKFPAANVKFLK